MRAITIFALLLANFNSIKAAFYQNCEVEGVDRYDWLSGYAKISSSIDDTHDGLIKTFKTKNIRALLSQSSTYMKATFSGDTLSIYTNERFKKFEEEYEGGYEADMIYITMDFNCTDNKSEELRLTQKVKDINNNDPIFDKKVYEYHFDMPIPEDYDLTRFLSISASDKDFSNRYIYFTMDYSEDVKIGYKAETDYYDDKNYFTSIKTLKELRAPLRKELTLVARDGGNPSRNTTALLIVSVTSNGPADNGNNGNDGDGDGEGEISAHPPVFAKHVYFANYTSHHDLEMEETITIKYGAENDTAIKQSGYDDYFKITIDPNNKNALQVIKLTALPKTIMESTTLLVIEIEAENQGLSHMPGRTALIIRLPDTNQSTSEDSSKEEFPENSNNCSVTHVTSFYGDNSLALIFFFTALIMIVVMNVVVLVWHFQKKKMVPEVVTMPYPIREIHNPEKMYKI